MSDLDVIFRFLEGVASEIGYSGAIIVGFAYLVLRNQSRQNDNSNKMVQALMDSNEIAANQRSNESKQDAKLLDNVLTRQASVLDDIKSALGQISAAFERFNNHVEATAQKQDALLDEFRTHESAALHRHETVITRVDSTVNKSHTDTQKVIQDAHKSTRDGINHVSENVLSTSRSMQGVNVSMASLMDMSKKGFEELKTLLQEIKVQLEKLSDCDNKADIAKATKKIESRLDSIEKLVKNEESTDGKIE